MLLDRASDIHTARVQELGRLCRYPVIVKGEKVVEGADSAHQVQEAFSFASGWPDVKFNKQAWQRVAMLKCKTAQDVFALADWLKAHKDEELKPENLNRLKQLLSTLNQQVLMFLLQAFVIRCACT